MGSALNCVRRRRLLGAAAAVWASSWVGTAWRPVWAAANSAEASAGVATEAATDAATGAATEDAQALVTEFLAGLSPEDEGVVLALPEVADNATSVPLKVAVDLPTDGSVYCEEILVVAEANPYPTVCRFRLTPLMGMAQVETRIRLAESQAVLVLARMSDGSIRQAQQEIMVTMGGCS